MTCTTPERGEFTTWAGLHFDIETADWTTFVCGVCIDTATGIAEHFIEPNAFYDRLISHKGNVWSWNGGLFDMLWALDIANQRKTRVQAFLAGSRIVRMKIGGAQFRDAYALCPFSLAKAAEMASITLHKDTGLDCECGKSCGGYCAITTTLPLAKMQRLLAYCESDVRAQIEVLRVLYSESSKCGYLLKGTVGGSSYASAAKIIKLKPAEWDSRHFKIARAAYFGGRTEVYKPKSEQGFSYDINSAYPAALTNVALPTGDLFEVQGLRARQAFAHSECEGIFVARVTVPPDLLIPPLPVKIGHRTAFPTGTWLGTYTRSDLKYAESLGVTICPESGILWTDAEPVFREFMKLGFQYRDTAPNKAVSAWHKWILNSCTGKLAEAPEKESVEINPKPESVVVCSCGNRTCRCNPWRPINKDATVWAKPFWRIGESAHVHWAAYLTAWTRQTLTSQLLVGSPVYADTDSCYSEIERQASSDLGGWKFEGPYQHFWALAPKSYRYQKPDGSYHVRCKGVPGMNAHEFEKFARGETITRAQGVKGLLSAAKSGSLFQKRVLVRTNLSNGIYFGSRKLDINGLTQPQDIEELKRLWL